MNFALAVPLCSSIFCTTHIDSVDSTSAIPLLYNKFTYTLISSPLFISPTVVNVDKSNVISLFSLS